MRVFFLILLGAVTVSGQKAADGLETAEKDRVVHELRLAGTYMDLPAGGFSMSSVLQGSLGGKPKSYYELLEALRSVPSDGENQEVLLDLSATSLSLNLVQLAELDRTIETLRKRGVKTVAYLENAGRAHYLAACACDRILMAKMAILDFGAPTLSTMFLKDALDMVGVKMQIIRAGQFKGAGEPYMLSEMSDHLREHYKRMLTSMNSQILETVATRRQMDADQVRALQADRLLSAAQAKSRGLVDDVVPWQGARRAVGPESMKFEALAKEKKSSFNLMSLLSGGKGKKDKELEEPTIVVLHLSGGIEDGVKESAGSIVSEPTVKSIRALANDPLCVGVLVRVNSPGGSATASEAVLLALRDLAAKKPMVVSMGSVAASGGYFVSMVGCPVFAEHSTITGSIGVFSMVPDVSGLAKKVGIKNEVVSLDPSATMDDMFTPLSESEKNLIGERIQDVYTQFKQRILEARPGLNSESLEAIAGGRVWSGAQAKSLGLVDRVGGLDDAMDWMREKLKGDLPVVHRPTASDNPLGFLSGLMDAHLDFEALKLAEAAGLDLSGPIQLLRASLQRSPTPKIWMRLPAGISIR